MKIAIVHDYFMQMGGAEKVAEELHGLMPEADVFATVAYPDRMPADLRHVAVKTSWMQFLPWMRSHYRLYFLLFPFAVSSLDVSAYDLVFSSSSGYVKGVRAHPGAVHVCYCHTPMRWVWNFDDYSSRESFGIGLRGLLSVLLGRLRKWDLRAAQQPDHYIANSNVVAKRIREVYNRSSEVIYPPIDTGRFKPVEEQGDFYITLSRLAPYKRLDLAVEAFSKMGKKLLVIGSGPALTKLKSSAGPTVQFLGRVSDEEVESYVSRCRALIFPGEEDFGMAPLEVASAGRPTIAYRAGGAVETIVEGVTGLFFNEQTPESIIDAVQRFEAMEWSSSALRNHAEKYSVRIFRERIADFLKRIGSPLPEVTA